MTAAHIALASYVFITATGFLLAAGACYATVRPGLRAMRVASGCIAVSMFGLSSLLLCGLGQVVAQLL